MLLANRLAVPDNTAGLLLDLDGVILDTLGLDFELVGRLLGSEGLDVEVPKRVIREYFPYAIPDFWRALSNQYGLRFPADAIDRLVSKHEQPDKNRPGDAVPEAPAMNQRRTMERRST